MNNNYRGERDQKGREKKNGLMKRFLTLLGGAALIVILFYLYLMLTR